MALTEEDKMAILKSVARGRDLNYFKLKKAVFHLRRMLGYTFDPKGHKSPYAPNLNDKYHREKEEAIRFVRHYEKKPNA